MATVTGYGIGGYGTPLPYGYSDAGCLITPIDPVLNGLYVDLDSNITLAISSDDMVKASTILVEVDRGSGFEEAFRYADTSERFKTGWDGPESQWSVADGVYTIVLDPTENFGYGEFISVRVTAEDPLGNAERLT